MGKKKTEQEALDLKGEVLRQLRENPALMPEIARALLTEATGGQPDAKGVCKGGASTLKAIEMVSALIAADGGAQGDPLFGALSDEELARKILRVIGSG